MAMYVKWVEEEGSSELNLDREFSYIERKIVGYLPLLIETLYKNCPSERKSHQDANACTVFINFLSEKMVLKGGLCDSYVKLHRACIAILRSCVLFECHLESLSQSMLVILLAFDIAFANKAPRKAKLHHQKRDSGKLLLEILNLVYDNYFANLQKDSRVSLDLSTVFPNLYMDLQASEGYQIFATSEKLDSSAGIGGALLLTSMAALVCTKECDDAVLKFIKEVKVDATWIPFFYVLGALCFGISRNNQDIVVLDSYGKVIKNQKHMLNEILGGKERALSKTTWDLFLPLAVASLHRWLFHIFHEITNSDTYVEHTTIHLSALTGAAAMEIGGETTAREYSLKQNKDAATLNGVAAFQDTRLNIIDEISFADYDKDLTVLSQRLQAFTECHYQYHAPFSVVSERISI